MVELSIRCDFCDKFFDLKINSYPGDLLINFKTLELRAFEKDWVYHNWNKRWYCPRCAEYRNAYEGLNSFRNRENRKEWHYVEANDYPPQTRDGITDTVLDQDGNEVFYSYNNHIFLKEDAMKEMNVYKWRYK